MRTAAVAIVALIAAGCASSDATSPDNTSGPFGNPTTPVGIDAPEGVVFTMDDHTDWLIGVLDAGRFDPAEVTERFDPAFLAQVPLAALNAPLSQIAPPGSAPWRIISNTHDGNVAELTVESGNGTGLTITVALTATSPHRIEGLFLQPEDAGLPDDYTLAQLDAELAAFAPQAALGIYDVTTGTCEAVHELNGDRPLAIGSIFKLWVLAELARQIHEGTATWGESISVSADLRSNPAGQVFQLDDGDDLSLREFAEAMISISDNTATDHLIDRLGRESVEAAMGRAGVVEPSLNEPLLATRELFWLKYLAEPPNPADWYDADTEGRRTILTSLAGKTVPWVVDPDLATAPNAEGLSQDQPRNLDIEYFASAQDLCRTLLHLDELSAQPGLGAVADILSINPGAQLDDTTWTEVRFKGGSEPGVFALAWWLERDDGRQYVVVGILNDPDTAFDQFAANDLINNALTLL